MARILESLIKLQIEPTFDDYFAFFDDQLPGARRCLLSRQIMLHREGMWQPATSRIPALCAHATESRFLHKSDIPDYLFTYSETKPLQLLVDIPEWDGVDRIKTIAQCLRVKNCSSLDAEEIMKEWGSRVFERLRDPLCHARGSFSAKYFGVRPHQQGRDGHDQGHDDSS
jgi:hypothetical protein